VKSTLEGGSNLEESKVELLSDVIATLKRSISATSALVTSPMMRYQTWTSLR
jgi:hypothetical protein